MLPAIDFPILLDNPRAWRTYQGGSLLSALHGEAGQDSNFPEEWILSVVSARNAGREHIVGEGLSHLADGSGRTLKEVIEADPAGYLGAAHAAKNGATPGILVKLIDSSERLTVQVHPDRQKAMELFHSPFGKTECWHILGGRTIDGEPPYIYFGFKPGVTREKFQHLFNVQDVPGMLDCMHKFYVKPGDTVLIEGGIPHAIGAGCFLVEIQEPTDYTIRTERITPKGLPVADSMCHQGLGFERMFDCFHFAGMPKEEVRARWFIPAKQVAQGPQGSITQLVGYEDTPYFAMRELCAAGALPVPASAAFAGLYILEGQGILETNGKTVPLQKGQQWFLPAGMGGFTLAAAQGTPLRALHCFGPRRE